MSCIYDDETCKYYEEGCCDFPSMGSGYPYDAPCFTSENKEDWTPVTEGLPKESGVYDVTTTHGKVATYVFGADSISSHEYWKRSVIAWMPRPEPYTL